jgi:hypothetical protein
MHVFKASLGGDGLGGFEPRAGVRDEANPGEDLIRLDHDPISAVYPLYPLHTIPECASMRVCQRSGGSNTCESDERITGGIVIAIGTFGNQPIAVKSWARLVITQPSRWSVLDERQGSVDSRCGAVAVGRTYLLPPLSFGGASLVRP